MALPTQQEFEADLANATPPVIQETDECPICMNSFTNPVRTPCNHDFCSACLLQAFQRTNTCPHCRRRLFQARPFDPAEDQYDVGRQRSGDEEVEEGELEEEEEIPDYEEEMAYASDDSDIRARHPLAGEEGYIPRDWAVGSMSRDEQDWPVGSIERDEPGWRNDRVGDVATEGQPGVVGEEAVEEDRR
ncbi:uncharacterized protein RHO25_012951 [Cercospora beticola]|uniref:RING-type domain-containing protein n=1 Tax=Cercospora beticola TaxID=122368 RepID=A0ABZ0P947_CERBT|nr:hypothetical protein RHO25_012951 [Cercospora beticola]CAK1367834.1 unnamed protein product [Cercospora beticola]